MRYWRSLDTNRPVKCPLDRSAVSFLAPNHALRERVVAAAGGRDEAAATRRQDEDDLATYNQRFAHQPRGLAQGIREDIAIYQNLPASRYQWWLIHGLIALVLLYLIFPFDLIPDYYGLIGFADDAFAIIFIAAVIIAMLNGIRESIIANGVRR